MQKKAEIYEALRKLAILKGTDITNERLMIYCEILIEYPTDKLESALKKCMYSNKFFPDISEILKLINPEEDEKDSANEMAGTIIDCIRRFGWSNAEDAKNAIGELGWYAIDSMGGWQNLCNSEIDSLGTLRAQLRDMCKMALNKNSSQPGFYKLDYSERNFAKSSDGNLKRLDFYN